MNSSEHDAAWWIAELSNIDIYPEKSSQIEIVQTHISIVVLLDNWVYKIKKSIRTNFLDFSQIQLRYADSLREVQLNQRLAAGVYVGVVPIVNNATGLQVEGAGEVLEWAVKMRRLPANATFLKLLERDELGREHLIELARLLAKFHQSHPVDEQYLSAATPQAVLKNALDNYDLAEGVQSQAISTHVWQRSRDLLLQNWQYLHRLFQIRCDDKIICDTHGDLHLDHVYWLPEHEQSCPIVVIDCIEFNDALRYADPIADIAFLTMDLKFRGRDDLCDAFIVEYLAISHDRNGEELLPFYQAYRAAVRAKVECIRANEPETPALERQSGLRLAAAYWLFAYSQWLQPIEKPALLLLAGLPGSGKSTVARGLVEQGGFTIIRTDAIRKSYTPLPGESRYSPEMTKRTYAECRRLTDTALFAGQRVVVDANFPTHQGRREFVEVAKSYHVPVVLVHLCVDPEIAKLRLSSRQNDLSDADATVFVELYARWEPLIYDLGVPVLHLDTDAPFESVLRDLRQWLTERNLW